MTRTRLPVLYLALAAAGGVLMLAGVPAGTVLTIAFVVLMLVMHLGGHGGHGGHGGRGDRGVPDQSGRAPSNTSDHREHEPRR